MGLQLKELQRTDYKKVIQFAIEGMHFNWYLENKLLLELYGRYFLYFALSRATQILAAYEEETLAGVLLCEMKGEDKKFHSPARAAYVKVFDFLQNKLFQEGVGPYDAANREMLEKYRAGSSPDGEIIFLAADPKLKAKGVGSMLLRELEEREKGKEVFLYTDNACTYQFYEHRGFTRAQEKEIVLKLGRREVALQCFLYTKVLG